MKHLGIFAAGTVAAIFAAPADAALFTFTLTGDYEATFQIDSSPSPDFVGSSYFALYDVVGDFEGAATEFADLRFYLTSASGGFTIDDYYGGEFLLSTDGPQLFTGTLAAPTFRTGTFALTETGGTGTYSLTIASNATAPVPEPASWAMMIGGFGMVGGALRHSRQRTSVRFAAV